MSIVIQHQHHVYHFTLLASMTPNHRTFISQIHTLSTDFIAASQLRLKDLLHRMSIMALPHGKSLLRYHDQLLFIRAYAGSQPLYILAGKELDRIARFIAKEKDGPGVVPRNEGLAWMPIETSFTPTFAEWLLSQPDIRCELSGFDTEHLNLNEMLNLSLPTTLAAETTAGLSNAELLERLGIKPTKQLQFLVQQMNRLKSISALPDLLFDKSGVKMLVVPRKVSFSRSHNSLARKSVYHHTEILKNFDIQELIHRPLPSAQKLSQSQKQALIRTIKNSMVLSVRETDPSTFMDESSVRIFDLDRGLQICIYGINAERQLPLESYFGFTAFKNGLPCSYGGAWVFGRRANIGLNIFEAFRGGESALLMAQLLRVYKQVFDLSWFEVEPYQYGHNNPEGIESAAFWFYYRFGFRPLDSTLKNLAEAEYNKRQVNREHRSSEKTLLRFTKSNIALQLGTKRPPQVSDITNRILSIMSQRFDGDHSKAETHCVRDFCKSAGIAQSTNARDARVLVECSLWAAAMRVTSKKHLKLMSQMIEAKSNDQYHYQSLVREFFATSPTK